MQLRLIVRWSAQRPEFATDHGFRYHKGVAAPIINPLSCRPDANGGDFSADKQPKNDDPSL